MQSSRAEVNEFIIVISLNPATLSSTTHMEPALLTYPCTSSHAQTLKVVKPQLQFALRKTSL